MKSPIRAICEIFSKIWNNIVRVSRSTSTTIKAHNCTVTIDGKTYKGEDLTPEQRKLIDESFGHMDDAFDQMGGAFKAMNRTFDKMRSVFGQKNSSR